MRFFVVRALLAAVFGAACASSSGVHYVFPLFRQCDPRWGSDEMGVKGPGERATICREGCAMTSFAMLLSGLGISNHEIEPVNPKTLNSFLMGHSGYMCAAGDCNNLVLNISEKIDPRLSFKGEVSPPPLPEMVENVKSQKYYYLAHVHHRGHFVLVTGWDEASSSFVVNDPYYNTSLYSYDSIADVITYAFSQDQEAVAFPPSAVVPFKYPLFKQCDSRWGKDMIYTETVCAVGCLMSSTSMAINGKYISINGHSSNPGTLNSWLKANGGYTRGNDLIESVVPKINPQHISWPSDAMHIHNDLPIEDIRVMLKSGRPVIANVMHGHHFVLVVGWDDKDHDTLYINDPGFARSTYSYRNDVVGWRLFNMTMNT